MTVLVVLHLQSVFLATQFPCILQRSKDGKVRALAPLLSLLLAEPRFGIQREEPEDWWWVWHS